MISAEFVEHFTETGVTSIEVCKKTVLGSPEYQVAIYKDKIPTYLLKIFLFDECNCFYELKYCDDYVVIGCGNKVHFFNVGNKGVLSIELDNFSYFGHLYPSHDVKAEIIENYVYVASASDLYKFHKDGKLEWKSDLRGIDGVVVDEIKKNRIFGEVQYDPPDGWKKIKLREDNGKITI